MLEGLTNPLLKRMYSSRQDSRADLARKILEARSGLFNLPVPYHENDPINRADPAPDMIHSISAL